MFKVSLSLPVIYTPSVAYGRGLRYITMREAYAWKVMGSVPSIAHIQFVGYYSYENECLYVCNSSIATRICNTMICTKTTHALLVLTSMYIDSSRLYIAQTRCPTLFLMYGIKRLTVWRNGAQRDSRFLCSVVITQAKLPLHINTLTKERCDHYVNQALLLP